MLNARRNRNPIARSTRVATSIAVLGLTILVAGFGAAAQTPFATFSGSVVDPTEASLPQVTLILTNVQSQAKHEVRSDGTGHFEFVGLPPGDYVLETRLLGFATLRGTLTLAGDNVQQDFKLEVGSIEETISVSDGDASRSAAPQVRVLGQPRPVVCGTSPVVGGAPIGGNIRAPRRLIDVRPVYPPQLRGANVDGLVVVNGRIGTDGFLNNLEVVGSAQPEFANAALEALSQWQFDPTLLNCIPIEVSIKVTVHFAHAE